jgi:hypothetical protein
MDLVLFRDVAVHTGSMVHAVRYLLVHAVGPTTAGTMALAMTVLVNAGIRTTGQTVMKEDVTCHV